MNGFFRILGKFQHCQFLTLKYLNFFEDVKITRTQREYNCFFSLDIRRFISRYKGSTNNIFHSFFQYLLLNASKISYNILYYPFPLLHHTENQHLGHFLFFFIPLTSFKSLPPHAKEQFYQNCGMEILYIQLI